MQKFRTFWGRRIAAALTATLLLMLGIGEIDSLMGQASGPISVLYVTSAPVGTCGYSQVRVVRSTGNIYGCVSGVWTLIQTTGSSTDWNLITNKPSTFAPSLHATSHAAAGADPLTLSKSQVGLANADNTSDAAKPISTAVQTALDGKVPTTRTINGLDLSINRTLTKSDIGLANVDNTTDLLKPISNSTQTALDGKVPTTRTINGYDLSLNRTLVKADIGLGSVDNTNDLSKPISTATQTALDGKVPTTRTVNGLALSTNITLAKGDVGLGNVDNTTDLNKPISTATQNAINALSVFKGKGTYATMTAAATTTNDIWLLTNAVSSGLCTSGGATNTAFAICVKDPNGVWQPILAATGGGGGGGTTIYGGFTGGGTTRTITDTTCNGIDDTAAVSAVLATVVNGDTVDFTNTTNSCDTPTGWAFGSKTNVRITHSPTTHPAGGDIRITGALTLRNELEVLDINSCNSCLFDKLKINGNSQNGCGFFINNSTNFSIQNNEVYGCSYGTGAGPYAAIKADDVTTNFWIANNNLHDLAGINGGEGVRGVWAGVSTRYTTTAHIIDNTITNTGHTGIAVEGQGPIVTGNQLANINTQGTCLKFIPRGLSVDAVFDNNTCNRSYGAAFQIETAGVDATNVYVRNNQFTLISDWTVQGGANLSFGALYAGTGGGKHIRFTGNTLTQGRKVAAYSSSSDLLIQNNTIVNGLGGFPNQVACEGTSSNVTINSSGVLDKQAVGTCTTHTLDGLICTTALGACQ